MPMPEHRVDTAPEEPLTDSQFALLHLVAIKECATRLLATNPPVSMPHDFARAFEQLRLIVHGPVVHGPAGREQG